MWPSIAAPAARGPPDACGRGRALALAAPGVVWPRTGRSFGPMHRLPSIHYLLPKTLSNSQPGSGRGVCRSWRNQWDSRRRLPRVHPQNLLRIPRKWPPEFASTRPLQRRRLSGTPEQWHQAWKPPAFHNSDAGNGGIENGTQKDRARKARQRDWERIQRNAAGWVYRLEISQ